MRDEEKERYINPYTDFGFKKLFGTEMNKDLLISFLNALFNGHEVVRNVTFLNGEHFGESYLDRKAIFDVFCENEKGEKFIVEMQKAEQNYFKDRSVYYATFPIREQAPRGEWDFQLKAVYTVGILNFVFPGDEYSPECYHHEVKLMDTEDKHVFYDKLTFVYLEMPKFNKTEDELVTMFDKWLFVLRNLSRLMVRPAALQERVFTKLFEQAEIARFTPQDAREYEESVRIYRDLTNVVNTAERKGREEGRKEEKLSTARKMKALGLANDFISQVTGLTEEEIEAI
ncbi:MAG: PD-(D/E)XK nuclease family transposase [Bacteroidaceae bacterium]|nr:PD-(D/E)XK nuclease family transposase [Bacteroidaceae bacterium]